MAIKAVKMKLSTSCTTQITVFCFFFLRAYLTGARIISQVEENCKSGKQL